MGNIIAHVSGIAPFINRIFNRIDTRFSGAKVYKRLKPIDCESCMAWWIAIAHQLYIGTNPIQSILIGAISYFTASYIFKLINK